MFELNWVNQPGFGIAHIVMDTGVTMAIEPSENEGGFFAEAYVAQWDDEGNFSKRTLFEWDGLDSMVDAKDRMTGWHSRWGRKRMGMV